MLQFLRLSFVGVLTNTQSSSVINYKLIIWPVLVYIIILLFLVITCIIIIIIIIPYHTSMCPSIRMSVHQSICLLYVCLSISIAFPDDNLSKYELIFTKLGMCIDIVEIWFRIANG